MTNSLLCCYRCQKEFEPAFEHQVLCAGCRRIVVRKERWEAQKEQRKEITLAQLELQYDLSRRSEWDIRIIDEVGREVWAKDLAKQYRNELDARQRRDFRARNTTKGVSEMWKGTTSH